MIFRYSLNQAGSMWDTATQTATFCAFDNCNFPYTYISGGSGQGAAVRNNAASVWNRKSQAAMVYYSSNFTGAAELILGNVQTNLSSIVRNDNASFRWV